MYIIENDILKIFIRKYYKYIVFSIKEEESVFHEECRTKI